MTTLKLALGSAFGFERGEHLADVEFERACGKREHADFIHTRAAEVFAEEEIFDLAFGRLIDVDAVFIEHFDQHGVGVFGIDSRVHAA